MNKDKGRGVVWVFAFISSCIAAIANLILEHLFHDNFFSLSWLFILPVGSFVIGAIGASGVLIAVRFFNIVSTYKDLLVMLVASVLTMFLVYYIGYAATVSDDGVRISDVVSFREYMNFVITKSHMVAGRPSAETDFGESGSFGFFGIFMQLVGVLLGAVAVFASLKDMEICEACNVYFKKVSMRGGEPIGAAQAERIVANARDGSIESYKLALSERADDAVPKKDRLAVVLFTLYRCPACRAQYVEEVVKVLKGNAWHEVDSLKRKTHWPAEEELDVYFKK